MPVFGPLRLRIMYTTVKGREEDRESKEYRIGEEGKQDGTYKNFISNSLQYIWFRVQLAAAEMLQAERVC